MFQAYRQMRQWSHQSRWGCAKFQIWSWIFTVRHWPRSAWMNWRLRRAIKKNPVRAKAAFEEIRELFE